MRAFSDMMRERQYLVTRHWRNFAFFVASALFLRAKHLFVAAIVAGSGGVLPPRRMSQAKFSF